MKFLSRIPLALATAAALFSSADASAWEPKGENIKTRWAAEVTPENARPEYPRPQLVRKNWANLNGLWSYAVTPASAEAMPQNADGEILVPFCIESSLSGVCRRIQPGEILWYRRTISAPEKWQGSRILLHFDAVDWKADVFINGKLVGTHTGGFTGFSFDVTGYLSAGDAELVVKVFDPTDDPEWSIPRGKQVSHPKTIWYTPVTGIWQTVWLEAVSAKAFVKDYNAVTALDGTIKVDVEVEGAQEGDQVKVEVLCPRKNFNPEKPGWNIFRKGKAKVAAGQSAVIKVRRPKLWTPSTPYLYGLRIKVIRDGRVIDKTYGYTAIRTIGEKTDSLGVKRLALNDEILFQFGPLDQGWWPDGLYTAPTAEAMAYDLQVTKDLGFNMLRKHIKVEPSRWFYDCDRLGLLVWQDMPCIGHYNNRADWAQGTDCYGAGADYWNIREEFKQNYYKEWTEIISMTKKFPCVVVWVPFNEAWGQFDTKAVADFTKRLDPTRLVNAASGGNWIEGAGDILDTHTYPFPRMRLLDDKMVNVLGEYGGIGRPIEGHTWDIGKKWGYVQFDSEEKVTDTYVTYTEDLINIKQIDKCAAAVYTQTTDVEGEVNGFMTYDRECIKVDAARVARANRKVIDAPVAPALNILDPIAFHAKDPSLSRHHMKLFTLRRGDLTMQVVDFGARIVSLFAPDRNGKPDDIIVGLDNAERYFNNPGERFLGPVVGRVANRIGKGRFTLDGKTYSLPLNNNGQTLHGGLIGLDKMFWTVSDRTPWSVTFTVTVPDGQDGFPGNLKVSVKYTLTEDNTLDILYHATTDKATPVNLSLHAFFNLKGTSGGTILDHDLTIAADGITPVDRNLIPTGEILPVEGTPFDFNTPHKIGERVNANHRQLTHGNGYDHNWTLSAPIGKDGLRHACTLSEDTTGRVLEIYTDQPGLQFYCGNFFDGSYAGKNPDRPIGYREALVFETQKWPDAVNHPSFPNTILRPGEEYTHHTVYRFSAK